MKFFLRELKITSGSVPLHRADKKTKVSESIFHSSRGGAGLRDARTGKRAKVSESFYSLPLFSPQCPNSPRPAAPAVQVDQRRTGPTYLRDKPDRTLTGPDIDSVPVRVR